MALAGRVVSTKNKPGLYDCIEAVEPDEPFFVLRANDRTASTIVRAWVKARIEENEGALFGNTRFKLTSLEKLQEALACANTMDAWMYEKEKQQRDTKP